MNTTNCALTVTSISGETGTHINSQFGWAPNANGSINTDSHKQLFSPSIIGANLTTPPQPGNPPYTGYETDLWGNARTGIGAFYYGEFSTYYLDAVQVGTGHAGTELDPWSTDDYIMWQNIHDESGATIYNRGTHTISSNLMGPPGFYWMDKWGDDPWIFVFTGMFISITNIIPKNGIIYSVDIVIPFGLLSAPPPTPLDMSVSNIIIIMLHPSSAISAYGNYVFKGCILACPNQRLYFSYISLIQDCVVDSTGCYGPTNAVNCSFICSEVDAETIPISCQFNLVAPTWPSFNAPQNEWSIYVLGTNLTMPPQPGNPPYTGYEMDPWGNIRTGIGAYSFKNFLFELFIIQRTDKHVLKLLKKTVSTYNYDSHFGDFGNIKTDNTGLNFPNSMTIDSSNNIYVCDSNNKRIIKFDISLNFITSIDVSNEIGIPHLIIFESVSGDLYVVGIKDHISFSIARIPTSLNTISKYNNNIYSAKNNIPKSLSIDFTLGYFIISGINYLLKVREIIDGFNNVTVQNILIDGIFQINGHIMHNNGYLYLNIKKINECKICKINSNYISIGYSDEISASSSLVYLGLNNNILIYDNANYIIKRYDENLNFIENVLRDVGSTISTDAKEIYGMIELDMTT